jgi:hypothetical protein
MFQMKVSINTFANHQALNFNIQPFFKMQEVPYILNKRKSSPIFYRFYS